MSEKEGRREIPGAGRGSARAARISRERFRREVFQDDWETISDAERTERLRSIMPPAYPGADLTAGPEW